MDDNEDNYNDHLSTLPDESDVNVSHSERLSGIVSFNSAPSLSIQTQAPQCETHVTTIDVNPVNVVSSQHSVQCRSSPISNPLQSFSGDASKKTFKNDDTVTETATDVDQSHACENLGNHPFGSISGERIESYSENTIQPMSNNDSKFTTITKLKLSSHISSLLSLYPMSVAEHSNNLSPDSNVSHEEFTVWRKKSILLVLATTFESCMFLYFYTTSNMAIITAILKVVVT